MLGGAVRSAQTRTRSRAHSTTATFSLGTNDGDALGAASIFGFGAIAAFALDPIWSLIFTRCASGNHEGTEGTTDWLHVSLSGC